MFESPGRTARQKVEKGKKKGGKKWGNFRRIVFLQQRELCAKEERKKRGRDTHPQYRAVKKEKKGGEGKREITPYCGCVTERSGSEGGQRRQQFDVGMKKGGKREVVKRVFRPVNHSTAAGSLRPGLSKKGKGETTSNIRFAWNRRKRKKKGKVRINDTPIPPVPGMAKGGKEKRGAPRAPPPPSSVWHGAKKGGWKRSGPF